MLRRLAAALALPIAAAAVGCDLLTPPVSCTDEARAGIAVEVRDSVSSAPTGVGGRVIATEGGWADTTLTMAGIAIYGVAYERHGTYTVSVDQAGYRTWTRAGVVVTKDQCHVRTVSILARLQR